MKIIKYGEFIKEGFQDTPEEYIKTALLKLQKKIESFFEDESVGGDQEENPKEVMTMAKAKERGEEKEKKNSRMSFKDMGVKLESSEMSKYSAIYDCVTIKYSDEKCLYNLFITIPLEDGIPKDKESDFSDKDIKKCSIKFKKYDVENFDLIGQIGPKKVDIDKINEEFLVDLKIELDDEFGGETEELEFET